MSVIQAHSSSKRSGHVYYPKLFLRMEKIEITVSNTRLSHTGNCGWIEPICFADFYRFDGINVFFYIIIIMKNIFNFIYT